MKKILFILIGGALLVGFARIPSLCTAFLEFEKPSEDDSTVSVGHKRNALLGTEWVRGCGKGVKVYLPTDSWADGVGRSTAWRLCEFDENGCLQKVHAQRIRTETMSMDQFGALSKPTPKQK